MEIWDPKAAPTVAGLDWASGGYQTAAKSLQVLAEEIANISSATFERNTKLVDDLRGARSIEDILSIQTKFMAGMFETFNEHVQLMGKRMADLRNGMSETGGEVVKAGVDHAHSASQEILTAVHAPPEAQAYVDQAAETTTNLVQAGLKANEEITKSTFDAAIKAAETIKDAAQAALASDPEAPIEHADPKPHEE